MYRIDHVAPALLIYYLPPAEHGGANVSVIYLRAVSIRGILVTRTAAALLQQERITTG